MCRPVLDTLGECLDRYDLLTYLVKRFQSASEADSTTTRKP